MVARLRRSPRLIRFDPVSLKNYVVTRITVTSLTFPRSKLGDSESSQPAQSLGDVISAGTNCTCNAIKHAQLPRHLSSFHPSNYSILSFSIRKYHTFIFLDFERHTRRSTAVSS